MRATLRLAALTLCLVASAPTSPPPRTRRRRQPPPPAHRDDTFRPTRSCVRATDSSARVSRGLAQVVEKAVSRWGEPNGYILGQEGGGAFVVGLRYGDGKLYTKNAGDRRVFWEARRSASTSAAKAPAP